MWGLKGLLAACLGLMVLPGLADEAPATLPAPVVQASLPESVLESSGLAPSAKQTGVFWTHGDSGTPAKLWAVDGTGRLLRTVELHGIKNRDWEDLARDEQGRLIVADIGDNARKRKDAVLYRLAEPDPGNPDEKLGAVQAFPFTYPAETGAQDAEALVVRAGFAYVFTKEPDRVRAFRVPLPETPPEAPAVAEYLGESKLLALATGASLSADGKCLALLTYIKVVTVEFPAALEATGAGAPKRPEPFAGRVAFRLLAPKQYEAVCWDGVDLLVGSEARDVLRLPEARKP